MCLNDNGLVETKNGGVIRKHMGYAYIHAHQAEPIHRFYAEHLNPYLNYHRPWRTPTSKAMPRAANDAITAATRLGWKPCWRCPTRPSTCATGSPPCNASPPGAATRKRHNGCNRPNSNSSSSSDPLL